MCIISFYKKIC